MLMYKNVWKHIFHHRLANIRGFVHVLCVCVGVFRVLVYACVRVCVCVQVSSNEFQACLIADTQLYKWLSPSVHQSVCCSMVIKSKSIKTSVLDTYCVCL